MGSSVLGFALRTVLGASLGLFWAPVALAQVPMAPASEPAMPPPPPPPSVAPAKAPAPSAPPMAPPSAPPPPSSPPPAAGKTAPTAPPPLDPPPANPEAPSRPGFLHTREEMERIKGDLPARERPTPREPAASTPARTPAGKESPVDFVKRSSPWVDLSLTSFWMDDRVGNFLNFGVQVGGYFFGRLRLSARLVAPLEEVNDDYYQYSDYSSTGSNRRIDSRDMSVLYGGSAGLMVTNSRAFVFGPSLMLMRTDVEAYGTAVLLTLPFEWTTQRNLRVGFEFGLGRAVGGKVRMACQSFTPSVTSCGIRTLDRPAGTSVLAQFYMGWSLGSL